MGRDMRWESRTAIVRGAVAFFAATVGFGLKALADTSRLSVPGPVEAAMVDHAWLAFGIVALLAVRLFTGASIHLVRCCDTGTGAWRLTMDIATLLIYGFIIVRMAYATSLTEFFGLGALVVLLALLWSLFGGVAYSEWAFFLTQNIVHLATFAFTFWFYLLNAGELGPGVNAAVVVNLVVAAGVAVFDINRQLTVAAR